MDRIQLSQGNRVTIKRQFILYHSESPEIPGTHLMDLEKVKCCKIAQCKIVLPVNSIFTCTFWILKEKWLEIATPSKEK